MNIKTGLSIFNTAWLIEPRIGLLMFDHWLESSKQGSPFNYKGSTEQTKEQTAYQAYSKLFDASSNVIVAPDNTWDLQNNFKGFDGAAIAAIPIEGPIMKYDSCGSMGTITIANLIKKASATASVKTILLLGDSPGGSVAGTESLAQAIKSSPKETICLVDGYACSAMYWIASSCDYIYAASRTSIIGSVGTMVGFYDNTEAMKQRGYVLREYYASASTDKNRSWNEALKGNGKLIIEETLDPLNNEFLQAVKNNRPALSVNEEATLKGKTYTAAKAQELGFIDGIKSFDEIVSEQRGETKKQNNSNNMKAFQLVLLAAAAASFDVVENGFLLSEEMLNNIESSLESKDSEIARLTALLESNAAEKQNEIDASAASITDLQTKLDAATAKTSVLEASLKTANSDKDALQTKIDAMENEPGTFFRKVNNDKDKFKTEEIDLNAADHNVLADEILSRY